MALTLEDIRKVKEKCRLDSFAKVGPVNILRGLFKHMNDVLKNPDLQFVAFEHAGSDIVIADAACKLYFVVAVKPAASTTNAWMKISDHATVCAAAGDVVIPLVGTGGGGKAQTACFPDGCPMANGITTASHTAVDGSTDSSAADRSTGFFIIGAP